MNFNIYHPNANGFQISSPFMQNSNHKIYFNPTSIHYDPNIPPEISQISHGYHSPMNKSSNQLLKSKSVDNLLEQKGAVKIGKHLQLAKNHSQSNLNNTQNQSISNLKTIPKTPILSEINYISQNTPINLSKNFKTFQNNLTQVINYSDEFLIRKKLQEEDVLSDDMQKGMIKSPLIAKISQKKQNENLINLQKKKNELDEILKKNDFFKKELKKIMEKKVKIQQVESFLIENRTLNVLLTSKIYENLEIKKKLEVIYKNSKELKILESLEIKHQELENQLTQNGSMQKSKIQIFKEIEEKKQQLTKYKEEIHLKEIAYHIELLNKNGSNKKLIENMKMIALKNEELFNLIKLEF